MTRVARGEVGSVHSYHTAFLIQTMLLKYAMRADAIGPNETPYISNCEKNNVRHKSNRLLYCLEECGDTCLTLLSAILPFYKYSSRYIARVISISSPNVSYFKRHRQYNVPSTMNTNPQWRQFRDISTIKM